MGGFPSLIWEVLVILFVQLLEQDVQKSIVIRRIHETETDIFVVQKWECRAVTDHQSLSDRCLKQIHGGHIIPEDADENEIAVRRVIFDVRTLVKDTADPAALGGD